jgi:hypothetical protein
MMDSPQWRVLNLLAHMLDHTQRVLVDEYELVGVRECIDELAEAIAAYTRALDVEDELPF